MSYKLDHAEHELAYADLFHEEEVSVVLEVRICQPINEEEYDDQVHLWMRDGPTDVAHVSLEVVPEAFLAVCWPCPLELLTLSFRLGWRLAFYHLRGPLGDNWLISTNEFFLRFAAKENTGGKDIKAESTEDEE